MWEIFFAGWGGWSSVVLLQLISEIEAQDN
jgi:hypothetical protein